MPSFATLLPDVICKAVCLSLSFPQHRELTDFGRTKLRENSRTLWLSEIPSWKGFPANFGTAGKSLPDLAAARDAIPAKVWALPGKENGCWKIGPAFGKAPVFSPLRPPQPSLSSPDKKLFSANAVFAFSKSKGFRRNW